MKNFNPKNRYDFSVIEQWISPNARVLDLGCGDGMLLNYLSTHKNTTGFGIEKNKDNWLLSLKNGLDVIQMDLESGLAGFEDNSFDIVHSRHVVEHMSTIEKPLDEMIRVATQKVFNSFFIKPTNESEHIISLDNKGTKGEVYHNKYSRILIKKHLNDNTKVKDFRWINLPSPSCELLIINLK